MKVKVLTENEKDSFWVIFLHASTDAKERKEQWKELIEKKKMWSEKWIVGRDFNDIKSQSEKKEGRVRNLHSFEDFRDFIAMMEMGEIRYKGVDFT